MLSKIPLLPPTRSLACRGGRNAVHPYGIFSSFKWGVVDGLCVLGEGIQSAETLWIGKSERFKDLSLTT